MDVPSNAGDRELLDRIIAGDEEAFLALYRSRQGAIYRYAMQMIGTRAVAEEVTQDVFLTLLREPRGYDPGRGSLSAYLYGIARHQVLRSIERNAPLETIDETPAPDNVLADLARQERIERVRRAVLSLPVEYREAVVLCDLNEMSYAEAAETLGCPVGTVRSRLHRARALLAEKLEAVLGRDKPARCLV